MGQAWTSQIVVETRAQHYRIEAARILQIAQRTVDPIVKIHLMEMAQRYLQLARDDDGEVVARRAS
jgi:hypothetical protein